MRVLRDGIRMLAKVGLLATAVVVATLGLGQESHTVSASNTEIFFSYSGVVGVPANAIVVNPGGQPRDVFLWVRDVVDPSGVSAYQLDAVFDGSMLTVPSFEGDPAWLSSTGRSGSCPPAPFPEPNHAYVGCVSLGSGFGPTGTGLLGKLTVQPGSQEGDTVIDLTGPGNTYFNGTFLVNTPVDPDLSEHIPVTLPSIPILFLQCADFNGDGRVSLAEDIFSVILRYQMRSSDPDWDPMYDLDDNGVIDLPNDILGAILQYQLECTQPA